MLTAASAEPRPVRPELVKSPASSDNGDTTYLRHLIEKQPACLLRVGRDGVLLACNDAGLSLLGKPELSDVLNRGFEEHLAAEYLASWREFVTRVWADDAGIARLRARHRGRSEAPRDAAGDCVAQSS